MIKYPINEPNLSGLEKKYVQDVIDSNWLSGGGKYTLEFEEKFSKYIGVNYSLAVQSGTAALHLALKSVGVEPDDNVILPNYSCGASISAVLQCGANPVVIDVEKETYGLDANILKDAIIKYSPKVVQLVHIYGYIARDTLEIKEMCKKYGVIFLEDACEALGAEMNNNKPGSFGDISIFSIRSEKMIGVGEGGVVSTSNHEYFSEAIKLASRNAPYRSSDFPYWKKYFYNGEGYNYLLPHLLGAIALAQIERFENEILPKKKYVGKMFRNLFCDNSHFVLQEIVSGSSPCYWLNSIRFTAGNKETVRNLGIYLLSEGIEVRSGFLPLSDMQGFNPVVFGSQDVGHYLYENLLVLPSASRFIESDIQTISEKVNLFLSEVKK